MLAARLFAAGAARSRAAALSRPPAFLLRRALLAVAVGASLSTSAAASAAANSSSSSSAISAAAAVSSADCGCTRDVLVEAAAANFTMSGKASLAQFKGEVVTDMRTGEKTELGKLYADKPAVLAFLRRLGWQLCRVHAADLNALRAEVEPLGGRIICFSFEAFGEGSDKDKSFQAGKYFDGPMYQVRKEVYGELFGRKGLFNSFYGLGDMSKDKYQASKERGITGNLAGDGMQLGGSFVVDTDGTVLLDHRQTFYGDDEGNDGLLKAIRAAKGLPAQAASPA